MRVACLPPLPRIQKSFPGIPIGKPCQGDPETRGLAPGRGRLAHQLSTGALFSRKSNHLSNVNCVISGTQWQWWCVLDHPRHRRSNVKQDTKSGFLRETLTAQLIITYHLETMYCSHCDGGNRRKTKILPHSHHCDAKTRAARYAPGKSQGLGTTFPRTSQARLFSPFSPPPQQADPQGFAIPAYTEQIIPTSGFVFWRQWGNPPLYPITAT